jgi:tRNA-guanine family transglycosylase
MPVATQASLKGLTPEQLARIGCKLCLNNTYHLGLKPGQAVLEQVGGAHRLQGWDRNILTDSGGWVSFLSSFIWVGSFPSPLEAVFKMYDVFKKLKKKLRYG